jgi:hypothetical protein
MVPLGECSMRHVERRRAMDHRVVGNPRAYKEGDLDG